MNRQQFLEQAALRVDYYASIRLIRALQRRTPEEAELFAQQQLPRLASVSDGVHKEEYGNILRGFLQLSQ